MSQSWTEEDVRFMKRALALAARGRGKVEPNPMVGAVVVKRGRIIGEGYHQKFGGPHAEVHAIASCASPTRGATVYVTLEPCSHFGKTPPCSDLLVKSKVKRVVASMQDPDERVSGRGMKKLRRAGIQISTGLLEHEARLLNAPYLNLKLLGRPFVIAKWAMTLDGQIATSSGDSRWVTGEKARRHVHQLRHRVDAILVGIGTAIADDPLLTCRLPGGRHPTRIILDSHARLPLTSNLVQTCEQAKVIVVVTSKAAPNRLKDLTAAGCEIMKVRTKQGECSLPHLMKKLGERQFTNLLVEGGQKVLGTFFRDGLVDYVMAYQSPKVIGDGMSPVGTTGWKLLNQAVTLDCIKTKRLGDDFLIEGPIALL